MSPEDKNGYSKVLNYLRDWCRDNPGKCGALEIAIGTLLLAIGVKTGAIRMGKDLVCVANRRWNPVALGGGSTSAAMGAAAGLIGGVGIATGGGAIGIPAAALAAGGAFLGGTTGYTFGDLTSKLFQPTFDWAAFIGGGSLLIIGTALIVDGCRRILGSAAFKKALAYLKDGVIYLANAAKTIVCRTIEGFNKLINGIDPEEGCVLTIAAGTTAALLLTSISAPVWTVTVVFGVTAFVFWLFLKRYFPGDLPELAVV